MPVWGASFAAQGHLAVLELQLRPFLEKYFKSLVLEIFIFFLLKYVKYKPQLKTVPDYISAQFPLSSYEVLVHMFHL